MKLYTGYAQEEKMRFFQFSAIKKFANDFITNKLVNLDLLLILRNKRPNGLVILNSLIIWSFSIYFLIEYSNDASILLLFIAFFLTAAFLANYWQFLLAWDSDYFPFLMVNIVELKSLFIQKYNFMFFVSVLMLLVSIPIISWYDINLLLYVFPAFLYNMGINAYVLMFFSKYNYRPIKLDKSHFFNFQGITSFQMISQFLSMGFVITIFYLFQLLATEIIASSSISLIGFIGITYRQRIIAKIEREIRKEKYYLMDSYRD